MPDHGLSVLSAVIAGLLGSVHCLGMCGGISHTLSWALADGKGSRGRGLVYYHLGRIGSYMLAGLLVGGSIAVWQVQLPQLVVVARLLAGLMIIAMGLYLTGWWRGLTHLERLGNYLIWRHLQGLSKRLLPVRRGWQVLLLGMLWGWLPCGLVYSTLSLAAVSGSAARAALVMASFGLATTPALLLAGLASRRLQAGMQGERWRAAAGVLVILCGVWTAVAPLLPAPQNGHAHMHISLFDLR